MDPQGEGRIALPTFQHASVAEEFPTLNRQSLKLARAQIS
jgi:hypothetical protein